MVFWSGWVADQQSRVPFPLLVVHPATRQQTCQHAGRVLVPHRLRLYIISEYSLGVHLECGWVHIWLLLLRLMVANHTFWLALLSVQGHSKHVLGHPLVFGDHEL